MFFELFKKCCEHFSKFLKIEIDTFTLKMLRLFLLHYLDFAVPASLGGSQVPAEA